MLPEHISSHTVSLFFAYADEDEDFQKQLHKHFSLMRQNKQLHEWDRSLIPAGQNRNAEIDNQLHTANIILLLISPDFLNSDYCCSVVMAHAMERHQKGKARVIPIILRAVDWTGAPFSALETLPKGGQPITKWEDRDEVYKHITEEIKKVVYDILGVNESLHALRKKPQIEQAEASFCPYLGAKSYSEHDAALFFGRETYIGELLHKLSYDQRLLLVLGPIGSGKTSVIQAGLLPLLRQGSKIIPRSFNWEILTCIPDENPSSTLLSLLGAQGRKDLVEGVKYWKKQHPKSERLVVVLDQFEELFKLAPLEEQKSFIAQLFKLIIHDLATIIMTMSDAYYSDLAEYVDFIAVAEQHISNIPPLQTEEILDVIRKPAQAVRLHFEDHLVEKIADDTMKSTQEPKERRSRQSSVLPLLSVCLEQLWERQKDHYVTLDDYEAVGQVSEALTRRATETFHTLDEQQQVLARRIFVDLVALGDNSEGRLDSRRQKSLIGLCHHHDELRAIRDIVEKLAKAQLLETHLNEQKDLEVKIFHESLLREWSLLKDWLREDHLFLLWYQKFEFHLQKWLDSHEHVNQRDVSCLLRGRMLTEAQQWIAEQPHRFPSNAQEFICASRILHEQEKQRKKALQEIQTRQRITQAKQLATRALLLQEQHSHLLRQSLLLAVEALRRHHCAEADQALRQGLTLLPRLHSRMSLPTTGPVILFSANGQSLASAGTHGVSWLYHIDAPDEFAGTLFLGNTHVITLSDNGEHLLAGVSTGVTWLIHMATGRKVAMIRHNAAVHCVALTQKQPFIAAIGYDDGKIELYQFSNIHELGTNLSERDLMQRSRLLRTFRHHQAIVSLSFNHDDRYLISAGMDRTVRVWNEEGGSSLDVAHFSSSIRSLLISPNDTSIAVLSDDGKAFVWQWEQTSHKMWKRKRHRVRNIPQAQRIQAIAFGPGGNCLTTASVDGFARIWNLEEMMEVKLFPHYSPVSSLCYHQGKDWLAIGCTDGNVKIYSIANERLQYTIPHNTSVSSIAFNGRKPYVATVDTYGYVWIWQLYDGTLPIRIHPLGNVVHLFFDQEYILHLTLALQERIKIWTVALDSSQVQNVRQNEYLLGWGITDDEKPPASSREKNDMQVFSQNGHYIASITHDGFMKVMKIRDNYYENTLKVHDPIELLTWSHDGEYIAFVNKQNQVLIWKWRAKNNEPALLFQGTDARALVFSGDDEYLIVADSKNNVFVWQWKLPTKEPYLVLRHEDAISTHALCSHTCYLLTLNSDSSARVWNITTGLVVHHLTHKGDILSAAFDSEGKYIATASADQTVGIWDASTGEQLASLPHEDRVYAVTFSTDGRYLATACDDSFIRIWQWKLHDLEKEAKLRLLGNFTYEEWQKYIGNEPYQETFDDLGWRELPLKDPFEES